MIEIIERHTNYTKPNPKYQVTCFNCGTIFTCNQSDQYKTADPFDAHFWTWGVSCPVCGKTNVEFKIYLEKRY